MLAEMIIDPAAVVCSVFAAITWLLGISYFLGRSTAKLDGALKSHEELRGEVRETLQKIFAKLDELSRSVPHVCVQLDHIASLQADTKACAATLVEHSGRMNRIQQGIRDKEQEIVRDKEGHGK